MDHKGRSILLFLVDGTPQSILIAEIRNWTGHAMVAPRSKLTDMLKRPEIARTGVYFLSGQDTESDGRPLLYIGESDNVGNRLTQHNKDNNKDFWEKACVITSKDQNLTKTHVRYLESRLISIARDAGLAKVVNSTAPIYESLPESDIADMEYFINQIRLVLPVLGLDFLREKPPLIKRDGVIVQADGANGELSPVFEINSRKSDLHAQAQEVEGDFVVLAGSECKTEWSEAQGRSGYKSLHSALYEEGKIKLDTSRRKGIFQEDVAFKSPSAAAAVIQGRASNGRIEWKVKNSPKTYADWQNEQIEQVEKSQGVNEVGVSA